MVRKSVMFSNVIVDIAFPSSSFVFSRSSCEASAGLTDVGGVSAKNMSYSLCKTDRSVYTNRTKYIRLTTTFHFTLMMTSAQVVETSVTITDNSPCQGYAHPDDQTTLLHVTLGLKPFTVR